MVGSKAALEVIDPHADAAALAAAAVPIRRWASTLISAVVTVPGD
ncbi:hypothetical protein [Arthrobacter sp. MA-N2]|nr:hypothetical protein [Arthrobacter sp. MA-N2]